MNTAGWLLAHVHVHVIYVTWAGVICLIHTSTARGRVWTYHDCTCYICYATLWQHHNTMATTLLLHEKLSVCLSVCDAHEEDIIHGPWNL